MAVENTIEKISGLLSNLRSNSQKNYATVLMNELIDHINAQEKLNDRLKSKRIGIKPEDYDTFIEQMVDVLQILGFQLCELVVYDKEALDFIKRNRHGIKKPMTASHLTSLVQLWKYYEWTTNEKPESLKDLNNAHKEIKENRE